MDIFSQYLQDLSQSFEEVNYFKFALNLIITAVLSSFLGIFYVRFGNAVSNRQRFARNFMPLALTTMLIIFIVKSSVALSLGLVGALSIVRFRSAIKDPEELVYLFLAIGMGLAAGADEIVIASVAFVFILGLLFVQYTLRGGKAFRKTNQMYINISTSSNDLKGLTRVLGEAFSYVELKRVDESENRLDLSFVISTDSVEQIDAARTKVRGIAPDAVISLVDQRNLAV